MEKNGMLTDKSLSDFRDKDGHLKKAEFVDEDGFSVADSENRDKLKNPVPLKETK